MDRVQLLPNAVDRELLVGRVVAVEWETEVRECHLERLAIGLDLAEALDRPVGLIGDGDRVEVGIAVPDRTERLHQSIAEFGCRQRRAGCRAR